jgi:hypothetical protein
VFCPSCGATVSDIVLERPNQPESDAASNVVMAPATRRVRPAVIVGSVIAVVAVIAVVGRNHGGTTAAPTTVPAAATSTTSTTSPTPSSTTTTTQSGPDYTLTQTFEDFAGGARTKTVLYGLTSGSHLLRIDIDRGVIATRRLFGQTGNDAVSVLNGGALVAQGSSAEIVADGPAAMPIVITDDLPRAAVFASQSHDRIWDVERGRATVLTTDGAAVGPGIDIPSGEAIGIDGAALVIQTSVGAFRLDPATSHPQLLSPNPVIAWSPALLVDVACDATLVCELRVVDRARGVVKELSTTAASGPDHFGRGHLSPDGSQLARLADPIDSINRLQLVDLTTGAVRDLGLLSSAGLAAMAWSPDGSWLFWVDSNGALHGHHTGSASSISIVGGGHIPSLLAIAATGASR